MKISSLLQRQHVLLDVAAADKPALMSTFARFLASCWSLPDPDLVLRKVLEREEEYPTGIGYAIAFPHCRLDGIDRVCMAAGRTATPVEYGAIDDKPVRLVFMFASPLGAASVHVETLKALSTILSSEPVRAALLAASDASVFADVIAAAEG